MSRRWQGGLLSLAAGLALAGCGEKTSRPEEGSSRESKTSEAGEVVVYVSEDQVFSEPILTDFEKDTGIRIKTVYDTEEAKSTGTMNRLVAEKDNPQADVYWANEPIRAVVLKQKGISAAYVSPQAETIPATFKDPDGRWTGFSARARVIVCSGPESPSSVMDYADPKWKGKGVIANPLFGTTTSTVAAWFVLMGDDKAKAFMEAMKKNEVRLSTSNGESTTLVCEKEAEFSLVDTDDAYASLKEGKPLRVIYPDQGNDQTGVFVVPNAAVLIAGGPNPDNGKKLIDYLLSPETERKLAFAPCAQIPLHPGVETPESVQPLDGVKCMEVDYEEVATKLQEIQPYLKEWAGL